MNGALDWEKQIRTGRAFQWGKAGFYFLEENQGCGVDLGLEQEKPVPACAVIEKEGEAGIVGREGKLVSDDILQSNALPLSYIPQKIFWKEL